MPKAATRIQFGEGFASLFFSQSNQHGRAKGQTAASSLLPAALSLTCQVFFSKFGPFPTVLPQSHRVGSEVSLHEFGEGTYRTARATHSSKRPVIQTNAHGVQTQPCGLSGLQPEEEEFVINDNHSFF